MKMSDNKQALQVAALKNGTVIDLSLIHISPFSNQLAKFSTTLSPDSVHDLFKELERRCGRIPEDKAQGVVKLDIDLLVFDNKILKPEDMEREYIRRGMSVLF